MKNMNEKKSNKVINALTNLSIKVGEQATGKCFYAMSYETQIPKDLLQLK